MQYFVPNSHPDALHSEKHSAFATTFPIYMYTSNTEEVPDIDEKETTEAAETSTSVDADVREPSAGDTEAPSETPDAESKSKAEPKDEDEAIIEDAEAISEDDDEEGTPLKMKTVVHEDWIHLNAQPPIWTRYV